MPVNRELAISEVRQPRGIVRINDKAVSGWIDFTVTNSSYFEADTFSVTFSVEMLPSEFDLFWFLDISQDTFIEILAGFPVNPEKVDPNELDQLIYGRIDDIDYDARQQTITLTGRDLAAAFIDAKVPRQFLNQTASQIVDSLVDEYQLQGSITATKGSVGTPDQNLQYSLLHQSGSDWDLISSLARHSGFICYVSDRMLYFGPDIADSTDPYVIRWFHPLDFTDHRAFPSGNVISLSVKRSLTITKGVSVVVQSFDVANQRAITRTYPAPARAIKPGAASPYGPTTVYTYRVPPTSGPEELTRIALEQYKLITAHAMKLEATLPGDGVLSPRRMVISVQGTGTPADQTYYARSVTRSMNMTDGYLMTVQAQNFTADLAPSESDLSDT